MSLLHRKEICVIRSQISSKSYKHARVLISSNLKINVVNRLAVFLVLATPPKLKARKSIWSVALLIMQYLYLSWPLKCSLWVLESRVTSRFQIQCTNDSQKGAVLLNVGRLSSRTPYFKRCQCSRGDFIDFNMQYYFVWERDDQMVRLRYNCIYLLNLLHKPSHNFTFHLATQQLCVHLPRLLEIGISSFLSEKISACIIFDQ